MLSCLSGLRRMGSCINVLRAASSSWGPPSLVLRALREKIRTPSFQCRPYCPYDHRNFVEFGVGLPVPQYFESAFSGKKGPAGSSPAALGSFHHVLQDEDGGGNIVQRDDVLPPSFLTTAVDCLTSDGMSSTIKTRCIMVFKAAVVFSFV